MIIIRTSWQLSWDEQRVLWWRWASHNTVWFEGCCWRFPSSQQETRASYTTQDIYFTHSKIFRKGENLLNGGIRLDSFGSWIFLDFRTWGLKPSMFLEVLMLHLGRKLADWAYPSIPRWLQQHSWCSIDLCNFSPRDNHVLTSQWCISRQPSFRLASLGHRSHREDWESWVRVRLYLLRTIFTWIHIEHLPN